MLFLMPWESATHVAAATRSGLLRRPHTTPLTLTLGLAFTILLWPVLGLASLPAALVFARLMALDLTTYTLPNIYTVPLIAIGLARAFTHHQMSPALGAVILLLGLAPLISRPAARIGMGGGDLKLLAALFAFLPLAAAFWALAVGSFLWLPVAFAKPKAMVPFGVPLILGWVALLCWPHLPNLVFSTIS